MAVAETPDVADARQGLLSRSFLCLLLAQGLGTLNDNVIRWLAVPVGVHLMGDSRRQLILSAGLFCFTLPYLLLATVAGHFADRFSKRSVIVTCKGAEIAIVLAGAGAIWLQNVSLMFVVVSLLGAFGALFGPAKFGSIPEIVRPSKLSLANGLMGLITVVSAAGGTVGAFWLYTWMKPEGELPTASFRNLDAVMFLLGASAVAGWLCSLGVVTAAAARPGLHFPKNPLVETVRQLRLLGASRPVLRTVLGIAFFWTLASLAQMNVAVYGEELGLSEHEIGGLMGMLVVGVGLGSVLAGVWSAGKVELGIVPLGALGIVIASMALAFTGSSATASAAEIAAAYHRSLAWMGLLGAGAGLFNVPLDSFLQLRSPAESRGSVLAASNFVSFTGILGAAFAFYALQQWLGISAPGTFLVAGLGTLPVLFYVIFLLPDATIRFLTWLLTKLVYQVRVTGRDNIPENGGALLVANHVSWVDGVLLLVSSSRPVRMMAYADYVRNPGLNRLARIMGVIPVKSSEGPKAVLRSLQTARQALVDGDVVCIFAEGSLTRTGQLQPFQRGLLKIVEGTGAPVVPVYLDGLWGSIFSFRDGKFFWKWPRRWRYRVGILFGAPLPEPDNVHLVRQAVEQLGVEAVERRKSLELVLPRLFLRRCRKSLFRSKVADSSGQDLTGGQLLMRSLMLKRHFAQNVLAPDERMVGVLLPPSVGGVLVNAALTLGKRIPVNLNYTASSAIIQSCINQCGIRHVLTTRKLMDKLKLDLQTEFVFVEDLKDRISLGEKLYGTILAYAYPAWLTERLLGLKQIQPDDLLTVIFTSGSTGDPKGVMLSHYNVSSNITAIDQLFHLSHEDVFLGVLPFFHSMGFTGTMWSVLTLAPKGVYHFNPLDARQIGTLCQEHAVTIMIATPTFMRTYLKRCEPEQFKSLDLAVVGAEKMPLDLAQAFQDKFGVRPIEGYGTTELSPLAAVNVPDHRSTLTVQMGTKEGTVGRPIPGTSAKVVDPDTWADLGLETPGLLLIKGPNVMQGYLNRPELTANVIRDGWYVTGDIAKLDAEGFVRITDRQSRFSKIGGEMVPHLQIEEALTRILQSDLGAEPELKAVVTSIPCDKKGERLIVVHKPLPKPLDEVYRDLSGSGLPNLWVPSRDSFMEVEEIPVLGTGKLDLRGVKELALKKFSASPSA